MYAHAQSQRHAITWYYYTHCAWVAYPFHPPRSCTGRRRRASASLTATFSPRCARRTTHRAVALRLRRNTRHTQGAARTRPLHAQGAARQVLRTKLPTLQELPSLPPSSRKPDFDWRSRDWSSPTQGSSSLSLGRRLHARCYVATRSGRRQDSHCVPQRGVGSAGPARCFYGTLAHGQYTSPDESQDTMKPLLINAVGGFAPFAAFVALIVWHCLPHPMSNRGSVEQQLRKLT